MNYLKPKWLHLFVFILACHGMKGQPADSSHLNFDTAGYFLKVSQMPVFPGGLDSIQKYLGENVHLSSAAKLMKTECLAEAKVLIDTTGKATAFRVACSATNDFKDSLASALSRMPAWVPGYHNGKKARVLVTLPLIRAYPNNILLDSVTDFRTAFIAFMNEQMINWFKSVGYRQHSVFYDEAIANMNEKNYPAVLRKLNKALLIDPYDVTVLRARGINYFLMEDSKHGCMDMQFADYLDALRDSQVVTNSMARCVSQYFFNPAAFLSGGYVCPPVTYNSNFLGESLVEPPQYPGGLDSLYRHLGQQFSLKPDAHWPDSIRILALFTVREDGSSRFEKILNPTYTPLDDEASRLAMSLNKWIPARQDNHPVEVSYIFPVINLHYRWKDYFPWINERYNEGVTFLEKRQYQDAIRSFTAALDDDSLDVDAFYNRGIAFMKTGDRENACKDWSQAAFYYDQYAVKLLNRYCDSLAIVYGDTLLAYSFTATEFQETEVSKSLPVYTGGGFAMDHFIQEHLTHEKIYTDFDGTLYISCIITAKGKVMLPGMLSPRREKIDEEALRLLQLMPPFTPGTINDKPVDMRITIRMRFRN